MANSNTYAEGYGNQGTQITTYDNIQGAGLRLPVPTQDFINIRSPGKIERLFNTAGNSTVLYNRNKPLDVYLKGPIASQMFIYKNIEEGQKNKVTTVFQASRQDGTRIRRFLGSSAGTRFILKQLVLQGFQPFDETKVYNPASPIIAALRLASFGLVDRPTRHLDTSNIVGGLLGGSGLGSIARTVGGLFGGGGPAVPSPPRSSVASGASGGLGLSTFTSLLGGADNSDRVVAPLARPDVRDLLRGQTATNAYNAPRYNKLVSSGGGGFFSKLLGGVGKFLQNNTIIGGIIPPKQPWNSNYRADEQTYDLYLNAGRLFQVDNVTPTKSNGSGVMSQIVSGLRSAIGIGNTTKFTGLAANQRFYHASINRPSFQRKDNYINKNGVVNYPASVGILQFDGGNSSGKNITNAEISTFTQEGVDRYNAPVLSGVNGKPTTQVKYTDVVKADRNSGTLTEQSDQLLNYKVLVDSSKNFNDAFTDETKLPTQLIIDNLNRAINNIGGNDANDLYDIGFVGRKNVIPMQFAKFSNTNNIGLDYLKELDASNLNSPYAKNDTYQGRFRRNQSVGNNMPTRLGQRSNDRYIQPTNNVDYVNSLDVLDKDEFADKYSNESKYGSFGPDIIKFYFYDIVNEKYIPFSATVTGIQDTNTAEWEPIEYLGRADKLYYYKGFTREVNFSFKVNAHSIKELLPMWSRINYLTSLTKPSNYTQAAAGGFMIPPMVQLTLGDFYKNHFVVIKSCNVNIPEDASWETLPEGMASPNNQWSWGPNKAFSWGSTKNLLSPRGDKGSSEAKFAQFPRTADISMQMSILEKDRPKAGRAAWGNAPVPIVNKKILDKLVATGEITNQDANNSLIGQDFYGTSNKNKSALTAVRDYNFSTNIRYDTDLNSSSEISPFIPSSTP